MATLTNTKIKDTYDGLLKTTDNDVIGASEKVITDGLGNASVLSIGTASASFSSDIEVNTLTIGKGANDVSTNTALGYQTLENATGAGNTAVGYASLLDNTIGVNNTAVGLNSLRYNITGDNNTAIGLHSLTNNTASSNTAVGSYALNSNTTGGNNTAIGRGTLNSNTTGSNITAVGRGSMSNATAGDNNTALGFYSLVDNQASNNVAVGDFALRYNTTGSNNTALGSNALRDNTTGVSNVALGYESLSENTTGGYNTAVGSLTLEDNTTGSRNTAVGFNALDSNTEGSDNTAIGNGALDGNTTGNKNVAVGSQALNAQTIGSFSTAVGYEALMSQTTGSNNTAIGYASMRTSTTGTYNTAIGVASLYDNTTGSNNVAIGRYALTNSISGDSNIGIGINSGNQLTTGSNNIYIGGSAVGSAATNDNEIVIGYNATGNGSNTATYGDSNITEHHFTAGQVNVSGNLAVDTNTLYVDAANNRVGIGKTPANEKLEVSGALSIEGSLLDHKTNATTLHYFSNSGYLRAYGASAGTGQLIFETGGGGGSTTSEAMRIDSSGNVGIGGTLANTKFYVTDAYTQLILGFNNSSINYYDADTQVFRTRAGGESMRIDSSGNVTITSSNENALKLKNSSGQPALIRFNDTSTTLDPYIGSYGNDLAFGIYGGGEKMRIDSSGNVGIGTQVASSFNQRVNAPHLVVGSGSNSAGVTIYSGTAAQGSINFADGTTTTEQYMGGIVYVHGTDNYMAFNTNGASERMRIDSNGNVGIGTDNPDYGSYGATERILGITGVSGNRGRLSLQNTSTGTTGVAGTIAYFNGSTALNAIESIADGATNQGSLSFLTNNGTNFLERMRITSGGQLQVGGTAQSFNARIVVHRDSYSIESRSTGTGSEGHLVFNNGNGAVGSIFTSGTSTSYNTSSDYRLKENVVEMTRALDRVDALKPSRFNFIADPDKTVDGFIAHEVQAIVPEAVTGEKDAVDEEGNPIYQGIDQSKITPLLTAAIKELKALVEVQAEKIAILESQLNA